MHSITGHFLFGSQLAAYTTQGILQSKTQMTIFLVCMIRTFAASLCTSVILLPYINFIKGFEVPIFTLDILLTNGIH